MYSIFFIASPPLNSRVHKLTVFALTANLNQMRDQSRKDKIQLGVIQTPFPRANVRGLKCKDACSTIVLCGCRDLRSTRNFQWHSPEKMFILLDRASPCQLFGRQ